MLNRTVLTGRMVEDPELRYTQSNVPVTSFRIAVGRDFTSEGEPDCDFFDVTAWRKTAEFICKHFIKGKMITVDGRLKNRNWQDKHEQNRVSTELIVDNAYFGEKKEKGDGDAEPDNDPPQREPEAPPAPDSGQSAGFNPFDN